MCTRLLLAVLFSDSNDKQKTHTGDFCFQKSLHARPVFTFQFRRAKRFWYFAILNKLLLDFYSHGGGNARQNSFSRKGREGDDTWFRTRDLAIPMPYPYTGLKVLAKSDKNELDRVFVFLPFLKPLTARISLAIPWMDPGVLSIYVLKPLLNDRLPREPALPSARPRWPYHSSR